jgi:hypothetical protein
MQNSILVSTTLDYIPIGFYMSSMPLIMMKDYYYPRPSVEVYYPPFCPSFYTTIVCLCLIRNERARIPRSRAAETSPKDLQVKLAMSFGTQHSTVFLDSLFGVVV